MIDATTFGHLRNVSSIDLTGTGNNTLKLDSKAVIALSGATDNAATVDADESKMLVVNGNAGDALNLADLSAWTVGATQTGASLITTYGSAHKFVSGDSYKMLTLNGATLFVDSTVNIKPSKAWPSPVRALPAT